MCIYLFIYLFVDLFHVCIYVFIYLLLIHSVISLITTPSPPYPTTSLSLSIGIFATHLHEIFDLPLQTSPRVQWKRMGVEYPEGGKEGGREGGKVKWTYQLEDGRCVDSMAWFTARKYGIPETILERARVLGGEFDQTCRGGGREGGGKGWRGEGRTLEGAEEVLTDVLQRFYSSSSSSSSSLPSFLRVPPGFDPSPSLEGSACLYILSLPSSSSSSLPPSFYVGETESARQRLAQHRARFDGGREGRREGGLEAVIVPLSSKSEARVLEGLMINELTQRGFPLWSDKDGRRRVGR